MTDQKLTKAAEKTLDVGHLHTYVRTWGLKRWEDICLKRGYMFRNLQYTYRPLQLENSLTKELVDTGNKTTN